MTPLTSRKATPFAQTREGTRLFCQRDLFGLAHTILGYKDMTAQFHEPMLVWSSTHPAAKKLHMAPRGTYKSSGSIAKRVQYILNHPEKCTLLGSNKSENAQKFLAEIKGHLTNNDLLLWAFPEILWTTPREQGEHYLKSTLTVKRPKGVRPRKEATIETNGVEGELVSNHYENGVFDDIVGFENSQTRTERMKVIDWYEASQALVDQPTPERATLDIYGTPWDYDDAYAHLLRKRQRGEIQLAVYFMPCWLPDPNGIEVPGRGPMRATFPEKLSVPTLIQMRRTMPLRFSAQYELTPADQDSAVFKRLPVDDAHPWGVPVIKPRREQPRLDEMWLAITVDPAIAVKGWNDHSALTVCGWDHENRQHVLWLRWGHWEPAELITQVYLAYDHFRARGNAPAAIGFEAIAFQRLFLHLFQIEGQRRGHQLPVMELKRDTKNTKQTRQLVLEPGWNSGGLVLYEDLDALHDLLDMANKFRPHKELTRDDLLDVLADNHQLRIRPMAAPPPESTLDPEMQERREFEVAAQEQRKAQGLSDLDAAALRVWRAQQRERRAAEEERMAVALGAGMDESYDYAGWR